MKESFENIISNLKLIFPNVMFEFEQTEDNSNKVIELMSMKNDKEEGWLHLLAQLLNKSYASEDYQQISAFLFHLIAFSYCKSFRNVEFMNHLMNGKDINGNTFLSILVEDEKSDRNKELIGRLISHYLTFINFDVVLKAETLSQSQIIEKNFLNFSRKLFNII